MLLTSFILAGRGRALREGETAPSREQMRQHLAWGIIYCNPEDPRGWVPKTWGPGQTVNARTRGGAAAMLLFTGLTLAGVALTLYEAYGVAARAG